MSRLRSNTCLAVLKHKKGLIFAGDRRISWGMHKSQKAVRPKVTNRNGILYAGTGVSAVCDLVTDLFQAPTMTIKDTFKYMHTFFMPALRKFLEQGGWVKEGEFGLVASFDDEDSDGVAAVVLIGINKDLYELTLSTSYISVDAINTPYAHGCGGQLALGSLLTTEAFQMSEEERLRLALKVAAKVSVGCDNNVDIVKNY